MSKNRKHFLRSSFIMLLVAIIALSSATYAWFTSSDTGAVTGIEFTAQSADGILISADALNWSSTVTAAQIKAAQTNALVGTMAPCSSAGTVSTAEGTKGQMQLYTSTDTNKSSGVTVSKASMATSSAAGYFTFDLYFKNDGTKAKTLSLITDYNTKESTKSSVTDGTKTGEDKDTSNAVRVAFVNEGAGAETTQTAAGVKSANGGTASVIWEPNAKTHGSYATSYRYSIKDDGTLITPNAQIAASTAYKYLALDKEAASTVGLEVVNGAITASKNTDSNKYTVLKSASDCPETLSLGELAAGKITKVTVYIWIEGQDVDCNNAEAAGKVVTDLQFKAADKST